MKQKQRLDSIPEPARAALRFIAMYQKVHPDTRVGEAAQLTKLLSDDAPLMVWHDDGKGRFEITRGEHQILVLDLTSFAGEAER